MSYHHLTDCERYQIHAFLKAGWSQQEIARELGRSPSTISRELSRNTGKRGYRPGQAQRFAEQAQQRSAANAPVIGLETWREVERLLEDQWSPEQIAGRTGLASTQSIYTHVHGDRAAGGQLANHLRCRKIRRKRYGSRHAGRGQIPNRVSIHERANVVDGKQRIGDWEGDTVVGKAHKGALVTLAERRSQLVRIQRVPSRNASVVEHSLREMFRPIRKVSHTLTLDNGKEFARHEDFQRVTGIQVYFADPYASWQRGLNEQINGLIRQYIPKGCSMENLSDDDIARIERKLNNRPRKALGYETPLEVFNRMAASKGVALRY